MARICGICPVSHLLASAKAGDEILAVQHPAGRREKLRRLMNLAQIVQSHALSFFHLSAPDLLLGLDTDPAGRNIFGLIAADRELARGRHPRCGSSARRSSSGSAASGSTRPGRSPAASTRRCPPRTATRSSPRSPRRWRPPRGRWTGSSGSSNASARRLRGSATSRRCSSAWSARTASWEHYDGRLRVVDADGHRLADDLDPRPYCDYIGEAVEPSPTSSRRTNKPLGYPDGIYRVGPLARLNVADQMGTPLADEELAEFRPGWDRSPTSSFHYHHARLIEILHCLEQLEPLLDDPDLLSPRLRADAGINAREGVGVSEAPRGTLFHHYRVDEDGLIKWVNLIIATGQNNLAMNRSVLRSPGTTSAATG